MEKKTQKCCKDALVLFVPGHNLSMLKYSYSGGYSGPQIRIFIISQQLTTLYQGQALVKEKSGACLPLKMLALTFCHLMISIYRWDYIRQRENRGQSKQSLQQRIKRYRTPPIPEIVQTEN